MEKEWMSGGRELWDRKTGRQSTGVGVEGGRGKLNEMHKRNREKKESNMEKRSLQISPPCASDFILVLMVLSTTWDERRSDSKTAAAPFFSLSTALHGEHHRGELESNSAAAPLPPTNGPPRHTHTP
jgi:hypothetical protein